MRVLHTSDLHLGRTLHQVDLLPFQAQFLDHLVETVAQERVDVVVISGDVYDRAIPPVPAVDLLSDALRRLSQDAVVIVTSGNHDSAVRLGFGAELMNDRIHLRTRIAEVGQPVVLADESGPVLIYPFPYLEPDVARAVLNAKHDPPELLARSHEAVTRAAMDRVRADLARRKARDSQVRSIVMAHAFVLGAQPSESERDLRIGGVDWVPSGVFAGVDYVALGHLHGPQEVKYVAAAEASAEPESPASESPVGDRPPQVPVMRYSGSPLAYSFSEISQVKSTVVIDFDAQGVADLKLVPAPVPRALAELRGTLDEILRDESHRQDWVRVFVTDPIRPAEMYARVRAGFPHALNIQHIPEGERPVVALHRVEASHDPLQVAADFTMYVSGFAPTPAEQTVLRTAYERVTSKSRAESN